VSAFVTLEFQGGERIELRAEELAEDYVFVACAPRGKRCACGNPATSTVRGSAVCERDACAHAAVARKAIRK
jgi:hypothetical protein